MVSRNTGIGKWVPEVPFLTESSYWQVYTGGLITQGHGHHCGCVSEPCRLVGWGSDWILLPGNLMREGREIPHVHAPSLPGFQEWQREWPDPEADEDLCL